MHSGKMEATEQLPFLSRKFYYTSKGGIRALLKTDFMQL